MESKHDFAEEEIRGTLEISASTGKFWYAFMLITVSLYTCILFSRLQTFGFVKIKFLDGQVKLMCESTAFDSSSLHTHVFLSNFGYIWL